MDEETNSSIDRLQRKLYARGDGPPERQRRTMRQDSLHAVSNDWSEQREQPVEDAEFEDDAKRELAELQHGVVRGVNDDMAPILMYAKKEKKEPSKKKNRTNTMMRVVTTIFVASFLFFLFAGGMAWYLMTQGGTTVSCAKVAIDVSGPVSTASGKEVLFDITIENNNPVAFEDVELSTIYPPGSRQADNPTTPLAVSNKDIGTVQVGETVRHTERSVLFGRQNEEKIIGVTLGYSLADSSGYFECEQERSILIATAPVSLSVDGVEEVASGQEFTLTLTAGANAEEVVAGQRIVARYPYGFRLLEAEPEPTSGDNVWDIGDLPPETDRTITLRGVIEAPTVEGRVLEFTMGEADQNQSNALATELTVHEHPLLVTRPFVALEVLVDEDTRDVVSATIDENVRVTVRWKNVLEDPIYDLRVEASLPRAYVDERSVNVTNGYFSSGEQRITWAPQTHEQLREIEAGQEGQLTFNFRTEELAAASAAREPEIPMAFTVHARRVSDEKEVQQTLNDVVTKTIKLRSDVRLAVDTTFGTGPFKNTGPYPPQAEVETTYTVTWGVENSTNDLRNTTVSAVLPIYVTWMDETYPSSAALSYNPNTRVVTWNAGEVAAGTGSAVSSREVSFRVGMTPSVTDIGRTPSLVDEPTLRAVDAFTGDVIERTTRDQTTALTDDPLFPNVRGNVVE